jgi:hypothetical protein
MYMTFNCQALPEIVASNLQGLSWSFSHFFLILAAMSQKS